MSGLRQAREDDRERSQVEGKAGVAGEVMGKGFLTMLGSPQRGVSLWVTCSDLYVVSFGKIGSIYL